MNTCYYCNTVFSNARAFEKHKKRATGCISWEEMHNRFEKMWQQQNEMKAVSNNIINHFKEKTMRFEQEIASLKAELANLRAESLVKEFEWETVNISAPFMGTKAKRALRESIKNTKEFDLIKIKVKAACPGLVVARVNARNKNLEIVLEDPELTECQVCFERKSQKHGACKVCELCERMQAIKYQRCAFCNTPF